MTDQSRDAQQVDDLIEPSTNVEELNAEALDAEALDAVHPVDPATGPQTASGPDFAAAAPVVDAEAASAEPVAAVAGGAEGGAAGGAKSLLRTMSDSSKRFASAVARAGDQAASKTKEFVDSASDKIDAVAVDGPAALRSGADDGVALESGAVATTPRTAPIRRTRKARLRISRLDPWSVMKTTLLFSIAYAIVQFIAIWVVWSVIGASGAFDSVNKTISDLVTAPGSENTFQLQDYINTHRVLGFTALVGVLDVILVTALATLGSFLYNLAATVLGGLEVTLAED